nr:hypothetical protein [Tanacetum cinerariifolium]
MPLDIRADEAVHQEGGDSVEMAITTDASLVAAQDNDNIAKTQSTTMSTDHISQEIGSGDRPMHQEATLRGADAHTRFEIASKRSSDPTLSIGHTVRSEEDRLEQETDLTDLVPPTPYDLPLSGGRVETSTDKSLGEDASKQGRNDDQTEKLNLNNGADKEVIVEDKGSGEKGGSTVDQTSVPLDIGVDEAVYQEEGDSVERAIIIDASLVAAQDSDNIGGADAQTRFGTASKRSSDPPLLTGHTVGSGEDSMEQETDLMNFVPPTPHDSPLLGGHTPGSDEGRPNINELMNLYTKLSNRVLALEQFKTAQDLVIQRMLKKVKRLEKKKRARTTGMKLFKIGTSKKKTLDKEYVSKHGRDKSKEAKELNLSDKGSVNAASVVPDVSFVGPSTSTVGDIFKDEMITMADTLMAIRRKIPRTTSIVIHDVEEEPRRATPPPTLQS